MPKRWTSRGARRYLAFQLPGVVLFIAGLLLAKRWIDLPEWAFWGLVALWIGMDLALFPLVWESYEPHENRHPMIGARGVAEDRIAPSGYVRIGGELWMAKVPEGGPAVDQGEIVRVRAAEGLTLVVERDAEKPGQTPR